MANVQGIAISRASLAHWTRIKRVELQGAPGTKSPSSPIQLERKALVFLITADWLQGEAAAQGIVVSPSEVESTYQGLLSGPNRGAFASSLKRRGMSRTDELLELRIDNLTHKLETKIAVGDSASSAQIAAYYRTHPDQFRRPRNGPQSLAAATPAIQQTLLTAERGRQVATFVAAYRRRWKQRTSCESSYLVPECRNGPALLASPTK